MKYSKTSKMVITSKIFKRLYTRQSYIDCKDKILLSNGIQYYYDQIHKRIVFEKELHYDPQLYIIMMDIYSDINSKHSELYSQEVIFEMVVDEIVKLHIENKIRFTFLTSREHEIKHILENQEE